MIRVGLIGYGHWGPTLARCITECKDTSLAAIADHSAAHRERAAATHHLARIEADAMRVIADPGIDAIAIATPVSTHFELAMAALRAGKHIWVEKPMADTADNSARIVDEAAKRNLTLMVDHVLVHTPAAQYLKRMLDSGDLGDLWYFDAVRANLGMFARDVNVIWDLAVHEFAVLDYLLGEAPAAVSASSTVQVPGMPAGLGFVTLHYPGGCIAHINTSWVSPVKRRKQVIGGSRRMVVHDEFDPVEKFRIYDCGVSAGPEEGTVTYRNGDMVVPRLEGPQPLNLALTDFARAISTGSPPVADGLLGLRVVEILEATDLSIKRGGMAVDPRTLRKAS